MRTSAITQEGSHDQNARTKKQKGHSLSTNPDFHYIPEGHRVIDQRLDNWSRWVQVRPQAWVGPIWKLGKSNGRQWHEPEFRPMCDTLDGHVIEKAVLDLPSLHCAALRWFYVYRYGEQKFRKNSGLTRDGLVQVLKDARQMLINRRV